MARAAGCGRPRPKARTPTSEVRGSIADTRAADRNVERADGGWLTGTTKNVTGGKEGWAVGRSQCGRRKPERPSSEVAEAWVVLVAHPSQTLRENRIHTRTRSVWPTGPENRDGCREFRGLTTSKLPSVCAPPASRMIVLKTSEVWTATLSGSTHIPCHVSSSTLSRAARPFRFFLTRA